MFFGEARREKMVRVILASEDKERQPALDELLPLQQDDFEDIFEAMDGLPVTIRLLEPPLHEFLPKLHDIEQQVERARIERSDDLDRLTRTCDRVRALQEVNPMLGTRGARLGLLHPEIYEMQVHAIFRAVLAARRHGVAVHTEILVPLVSYRRELELLLGLIRRAADTHGLRRGADFFSFGTNDLTQTALGFSRDDIESRILSRYIESTVFDRSPFETLDASGVGHPRAYGCMARPQDQPQPEARRLRRARGRPGLNRLLPSLRHRLRLLLTIPRPCCPGRRCPSGGAREGRRAWRRVSHLRDGCPSSGRVGGDCRTTPGSLRTLGEHRARVEVRVLVDEPPKHRVRRAELTTRLRVPIRRRNCDCHCRFLP